MVKDSIESIKKRILAVCSRVGEDPERITLVAVGKGRVLQQVKEAVGAGITDIGENRVHRKP